MSIQLGQYVIEMSIHPVWEKRRFLFNSWSVIESYLEPIFIYIMSYYRETMATYGFSRVSRAPRICSLM